MKYKYKKKTLFILRGKKVEIIIKINRYLGNGLEFSVVKQ